MSTRFFSSGRKETARDTVTKGDVFGRLQATDLLRATFVHRSDSVNGRRETHPRAC